MKPPYVLNLMLLAATTGAAGIASAQSYPTKPIRMITTEAGSALDLTARIVAQGLAASLGYQVIVDNRPVATFELVAHAPADGYTLLNGGSTMWVLPFLRKTGYDPVKDFAPITQTVSSPNILVVHPSIAANTVQELVAVAKAKPGQLNYGASISGGTPHLAAEMLKSLAHIDMVRVAYKGVAPALNDLVGGRIHLMFPTVSSGLPHAKAGRLRALAVTSVKPSALAPGLPTVAESGLPGYEMIAIFGVFAPAKTPSAIVARLNRDIVQYISQPELRQKFLAASAEVVADTPQQFKATIAADMARMSKLIREQNIHEE